jgi:UDP-glucose 4-epimerase
MAAACLHAFVLSFEKIAWRSTGEQQAERREGVPQEVKAKENKAKSNLRWRPPVTKKTQTPEGERKQE